MIRLALAAAALCCAGAACAAAMSKETYEAQQVRVEADYDAAQARCKALAGNGRDVCRQQARGERDIAQAALALQYQPTADNDEKLRIARAEAAYAVARQRCKTLDGSGRDICNKDARAVLAAARAEAKLQKDVVAQQMRSDTVVRERTEREEKIAQAQFNAARERCEMLPDEGRDNCLRDAKRRFGRL
jgi:hypothetical protein